MKTIKYILFLAVISFFASCKVDFNPNASWKDVPAVYCLLDQDDDTTWVRVQRCYLGQDDLYSYTQIADSINYPQGSIQVKMLQWKGSVLQHEYNFDYTELHDKDSGLFAYNSQPMYACRTKGMFDEDALYELLVLRDGDTLARSTTQLIRGNYHLYEPNSQFSHEFKFRNNVCNIEWTSLTYGRLYETIVRFYFKEHGDTVFVDIPCGSKLVQRANENRLAVVVPVNNFMTSLQNALIHDTCHKYFVNYVGIIVNVCAEDLNAYINSQNLGTSVAQDNPIYTNIDGGVGIFSARRLHLSNIVPSDSTTGSPSNPSYRDRIRQLNIGFEAN